jgi:branched-chain amino acid transport system substrate-binding protein
MIGQAFRKFKFSYLLCVMRSSEQCEGVLAVVQHRLKGKDKLFGDVTIRQDGRVIHPMYLFEVKKPEESKYPYDYYRLVSTIPADQAFRPIEDGGCPMIK